MSKPIQCRHYWVLPTPSGRYCIGTCRQCGEQKQFSNIVDDNVKYGRGWRGKGSRLARLEADIELERLERVGLTDE